MNSSSISGNSTIYNSVTQRLRKERGQNLDAFINTFMQSIEQSSNTDVGEDVIEMKDSKLSESKPQPPGRSLVFGDLFGMKSSMKSANITIASQQRWIHGPSQCLIYICKLYVNIPTSMRLKLPFFGFSVVHILNVSRIFVRFVLGMINCLTQPTVDLVLCKCIDRLLRIALFEPRLTLLVRTVEDQLFGAKQADASFTELLERQRQAKKRLAKISLTFASVADTLQSPTLNKHLMYCLFDMIVAELYPELGTTVAKD